MTARPPGIVILGGGSAGWIVANALAAEWAEYQPAITLLESPAIGTVGVGEGSTPRLKQFFDRLGIAEAEWMPRCNATYKNGIRFAGWSAKPGFDEYFHPFPTQVDQHTATAFYHNSAVRRQGVNVAAHPNDFFLSAYLAKNDLGPKAGRQFPFLVEYGYHFDAQLLGEFLKEKAMAKGVAHHAAKVTKVEQNKSGDITALCTDTGERVEGDFFVDCSGFVSALMQKTLDVPFVSFAENLFNDAAVVLPTSPTESIASETKSTALSCGWAWEIPLTERRGNGYVYASAYCSADQAETELRTHLGLLNSDIDARHLKMKVGRLEQHWHRNCLAVGLSQGFIEPLEATALNLVCNTIYDFIETFSRAGFQNFGREAFNKRVNGGFESIRDYIVAHYILNSRKDSSYWRDNGSNPKISSTLSAILDCWMSGQHLAQAFEREKISTSYSALSWYCLLAGYGIYPEADQLRQASEKESRYQLPAISDFISRCGLNFSSHAEQLDFGAESGY